MYIFLIICRNVLICCSFLHPSFLPPYLSIILFLPFPPPFYSTYSFLPPSLPSLSPPSPPSLLSSSMGGIPRRNQSFNSHDVTSKPTVPIRHNGYRDTSEEAEDGLDEYHQYAYNLALIYDIRTTCMYTCCKLCFVFVFCRLSLSQQGITV